MIDNVILLISGTLHNRERQELLDKCHPLGFFDGMAALTTANTPADLYNIILVATPLGKVILFGFLRLFWTVGCYPQLSLFFLYFIFFFYLYLERANPFLLGPYFSNCISVQDLDEVNIEIIRNTLYKSYLEDFYRFCEYSLNAETFAYMKILLQVESDQRCISITLNSIGTELNKAERLSLYPRIGKLYPEGHFALASLDEIDDVKNVVSRFPVDLRQLRTSIFV